MSAVERAINNAALAGGYRPRATAAPEPDRPDVYETFERQRVSAGERVWIMAPGSEVCVHLRVAGKFVEAELTGDERGVQLYEDGRKFSFPILPAEAGFLGSRGAIYAYVVIEVASWPPGTSQPRFWPASHGRGSST